jgi:hypothetical protein
MARRLRIVAVVIGTAVFMTAAVGCMMTAAPSRNPGIHPTTKMWPFKQDGGASPDDLRAWARKYGQDARQMPNLPDVNAATPEQRAAAIDLMRRTEAGTAAFANPDAAVAAGYTLIGDVVRAGQNPAIAKTMEALDGAMPGMMSMLHVANVHHSNAVLDPNAPDDLMYDYQADGTWKLSGVMYMADGAYPGPPPDPGGPITRWHYHSRMKGVHLMMHVFFVPDNDLAHAYAYSMDGM